MHSGYLDTLQWLRQQAPRCPWAGPDVWAAAASNGHFHILEYLKQQRCDGWDAPTCTAAAGAGRLDVLDWLTKQQPPCPYDIGVFSAGVKAGHVHVLEWYVSHGGSSLWNLAAHCTAAARFGHLDVLKWLCSLDLPPRFTMGTCAAAAAGGHLHILQWLRQQDPPCPEVKLSVQQQQRQGTCMYCSG
eukprot:GHUV01031849.1.p1 GENE.GHUV01031849.1~~GHUV01031849.1.p1  ORF type:complete len:187 (+),score=59.90 GHUV01031849.1:458-1018(+)